MGATILTLMTEDYNLDELDENRLEEFVELIQKLGRGQFKAPNKLAKAIKAYIRGSCRLSLVQQNSVNIVLSLLAREIRSLER